MICNDAIRHIWYQMDGHCVMITVAKNSDGCPGEYGIYGLCHAKPILYANIQANEW